MLRTACQRCTTRVMHYLDIYWPLTEKYEQISERKNWRQKKITSKTFLLRSFSMWYLKSCSHRAGGSWRYTNIRDHKSNVMCQLFFKSCLHNTRGSGASLRSTLCDHEDVSRTHALWSSRPELYLNCSINHGSCEPPSSNIDCSNHSLSHAARSIGERCERNLISIG